MERRTRTSLSGCWFRMGTPQYAQVWLLYQEVKTGTGISSSFRTKKEAVSTYYKTKSTEGFSESVK